MRRVAGIVLVVLIVAACAGTAYGAACCEEVSACCVTATVDNQLTAAEKANGWRLLFDGKTLEGWSTTQENKGWIVEDGAMELSKPGQGGYIYPEDQYGDFELKLDFMVAEHTNSGVFFRWADLRDPVQTGIEMQVLDSAGANPPGKHDCGAVYDVLAPSSNPMKPAMQWNSLIIRCRKSFIDITLNGKRIISMDLNKYTQPHKNLDGSENKFGTAYKDMPRVGYIGFQDHGGKVWFKNIKIRLL